MVTNVINIGDAAFRTKRERYGIFKPDECKHLHLTLDDHGDTVQCDDCKVFVSAYWALKLLTMQFQRQEQSLAARRAQLDAETADKRLLIATRKLDKAWRSRTMAPACPHCWRGIFPEDNLGGSQVNRDIELRRRETERAAKSQSQQEPSV